MKQQTTEIIFILDRSGSMSGLETDTIGGFNSMLEKQKKESSKCLVSTVLFDDKIQVLHDRQDLQTIAPLTDKEYYVRGTTALLDAVGRSINAIERKKGDKKHKVLFIITTDGYENASTEYTYASIKQMIEAKKKNGWEFIFLGANIDAASTASDIGISKERVAQFHNDTKGVATNYEVLSKTVQSYRKEAQIDARWCEEINKDYDERK